MRDLVLTVNGIRLKAKKLDEDFARYVEKQLEASGVQSNRDNPTEKLFLAYLKLAAKSYNYEREIEAIIEE
jgi:hypothetical protein